MKGLFKELFFYDKRKYYEVIDFFEYILNDDFEHYMKLLSQEIGFDIRDYNGINFPSFFEEWDKDVEGYFEEGVEFFGGNPCDLIYIIIDNQMFAKCVELACVIYFAEHGKNKNIEKYLNIIKEKYL